VQKRVRQAIIVRLTAHDIRLKGEPREPAGSVSMSARSTDLFLKACGVSGPLQVYVEDRERGEASWRIFPQPFALIGRDSRADLILKDTEVSRRHLYLQVIAGRVFCIDLGSRTGLRWENGARPAGWLNRGESVEVGRYRIGLGSGEPGEFLEEPPIADLPSPLVLRSMRRSPLLHVAMLGSQGVTDPPLCRLNRVVSLVGRAPDCKFQLLDESVSRIHCSLLHTPQGVWVVDLLGRGGIHVNGSEARFARLDNGDELRLGRFLIRPQFDQTSVSGESPTPWPSSVSDSGVGLSLPSVSGDRPEQSHRFLMRFPGPAPLPATIHSVGSTTSTWLPAGDEVRQRLSGLPQEQVQWVETLLMPVVNQMGQMQQQMFDQFQQAIVMMFQMFGTLQRDHMRLVRDELDQIRSLTAELQALQAEAASRPLAALDHNSLQSEKSAIASEQAISSPNPSVQVALTDLVAQGQAPLSPPGLAQPPLATVGSGNGSALTTHESISPITASNDQISGAVRTQSASADDSLASSSTTGDFPIPEGQPTAKPASPVCESHIHAVLSQRIAAIQKERESRWQRILNLITGTTQDNAAM